MAYVKEAKELSVLVGSHYFNCTIVNEEVGDGVDIITTSYRSSYHGRTRV